VAFNWVCVEVALTGPAARIVGGIVIVYAAYCITTQDNDAGDACSEEESKMVACLLA
jgi:hypothetical protein